MNQYEMHIAKISKEFGTTPEKWKNMSPIEKIMLSAKSKLPHCPECGAEHEHYLICSKSEN